MMQELSRGERKAHKAHQCFDCYRTIPKGAMHAYFTGAYDGSAYTLRSHLDCRDASIEYASAGWDDYNYEGIPPLADMMHESGEFEDECDRMRGFFPHVIARLELTEQLAEIRHEARLAEIRHEARLAEVYNA